MGLFGLGKKKVDKAAWCKAVYGQELKHPENEPEERLSALTSGLLFQQHRIIMDSVRIIKQTRNTDTRQGRIDLCFKRYEEMQKLKPFCNKEQLALIAEAESAMKSISLL